jgi:hypothetical protein
VPSSSVRRWHQRCRQEGLLKEAAGLVQIERVDRVRRMPGHEQHGPAREQMPDVAAQFRAAASGQRNVRQRWDVIERELSDYIATSSAEFGTARPYNKKWAVPELVMPLH